LEREREKLYVTDAELIRRIGAPERIARAAITTLDHDPRSGFPKKQKAWGDRRYWPAVVAYFDKLNRLGNGHERQADNNGRARAYVEAPQERMGGALAGQNRFGPTRVQAPVVPHLVRGQPD
jgi:hypothetical protein